MAKHAITKLHSLSHLSEYSATSVSDAGDPTLERSRVEPGDGGNRASGAFSTFMEQLHRALRLWTGRFVHPMRQRAAKAYANLVRFRPVTKPVYDRSEHAGVFVLREHDIPR